MKTFTTRQAFQKLIAIRAIHHDLGITSNSVRSWRDMIKKGRWPSEELMKDWLQKAGYTQLTQPIWTDMKHPGEKISYLKTKIEQLTGNNEELKNMINMITDNYD